MRIPALLSLLLLSACETVAPRPAPATQAGAPAQLATAGDLSAEYRRLAGGGGTVYSVDPESSKVLFYVFRGGKAAKLGHNHVVRASQLDAYVYLPSDEAGEARFDLRVPLEGLVVDEPALRSATAGNFSGERSESDIEGTKANMLGPRGLDSAQFPVVSVKSVSVAGDWPWLVAEVAVTLHGVSRTQATLLHARRDASTLQVKGSLVLKQSDFGITPFSLFGGLMAVQDAVAVEFDLSAKPP